MYDVIIIGGGPGGYLAAERLGQGKKKTLLIEEKYLGGTCLNVGCIPTKTLLNSAKHYVHAKEGEKFGVLAPGVSFDWNKMRSWKNEVTGKLREGIAGQMKRFAVEVVSGRGEILAAPSGTRPGRIKVSGGTTAEYGAQAILAAPGSSPAFPPIPGSRDNSKVVDSTGLLSVEAAPKKLAVIGGGVIGVEFAGLFSSLGSEVTVIEMMDEIVPFMDRDQAPLLRRGMKNSAGGGSVDFKLGCKVESIDGAVVRYSTKDGAKAEAAADLVLMAAGRRPVLDTWGAAAAGLDMTGKGVAVNERMRTNIPGIWAAGDVTGKSLLAHSAYRMAEVAVADITAYLEGTPADGNGGNLWRDSAVPWAVYGIPEAAGVGLTEQEAEARGIPVLKATLPMRVSGRFAAENTFAGQGAVKVIASAGDRRILGIHAVGSYASEFIWGGAALIEQELRIEDVRELIFPHPTVCELIRDAVWEIA
ncbi:MAG: dihydrolipoyl dehydrogenase [Treponema sp.]|nr:dihydrolipoyl dehydrogenase [Treponema sp.]